MLYEVITVFVFGGQGMGAKEGGNEVTRVALVEGFDDLQHFEFCVYVKPVACFDFDCSGAKF